MINNDSPLNWLKLFQLRNLLHNANASFFILFLQSFSFSISVFFFFEYSIWSFIYPIWVWFISTWKWFIGKIPKAWDNFGILPTVKLPFLLSILVWIQPSLHYKQHVQIFFFENSKRVVCDFNRTVNWPPIDPKCLTWIFCNTKSSNKKFSII